MAIRSVSIHVGSERKSILVMIGNASVFLHGSYDEIRAFATQIIAKADEGEAWGKEAAHETLAEPSPQCDR